MPSNKASIYDGSVAIDAGGILDLTGITVVQANGAFTAGGTSITADATSGDPSTHLSVGEEIFNINLEYIGTVKSVSSTTITLYKRSLIALGDDDYIYKYPKYEIAAILCCQRAENLGGTEQPLFDDTPLIPVTTKWASSAELDGTTWTATADTDFGARDAGSSVGLGSSMGLMEPSPGDIFYGRWKYCGISVGAASQNDSVICYLKATPTRGKQNIY